MHGYVLFNLAACIPKTHKKKLLPVRLNQFICHALDTAKIVVIRIKEIQTSINVLSLCLLLLLFI